MTLATPARRRTCNKYVFPTGVTGHDSDSWISSTVGPKDVADVDSPWSLRHMCSEQSHLTESWHQTLPDLPAWMDFEPAEFLLSTTSSSAAVDTNDSFWRRQDSLPRYEVVDVLSGVPTYVFRLHLRWYTFVVVVIIIISLMIQHPSPERSNVV